MKLLFSLLLSLMVLNGGRAEEPRFVNLPGKPFAIAVSPDDAWIFVALMGAPSSGVAVIQKNRDKYTLKRLAPLEDAVALVLTHDGKTLVAAGGDSVFLLDAGRLESEPPDAAIPLVAKFDDGANTGCIFVNVTRDDKTLFVSDEGTATISVVDLEAVRSGGWNERCRLGKIPTGEAPIALTFSPDERYLYTTCEAASPKWGWPKIANPEGPGAEGAVVVVDVAKARTDPAKSVVSRVPAGASPVRLAISPDGGRIYVTARASNAVVAFDAGKLVSDPEHAKIASVPVGAAPVPIAVAEDGKAIVVGNSNRFGAPGAPQSLTVLDAAKIGAGDPVLGTIKAGAFPRAFALSSDGATLYLSNFNSNTLEIIDGKSLPIEPRK